ncbi:MAG: hypothetical protein K0Q79_3679 [Flavipsychrobacter sp.]|jgi:class 3 adenylate cyclase/Tfp pilus assembly protein PilF|nr:hypothetical protein [Flavipsychrobacter sp.]
MQLPTKYLLLLLLTLSTDNLYAQLQGQAKLDSLLKELLKTKEDTNKVNLLVILSDNYNLTDVEEGFKYAQSAMQLATAINWQKGRAMSNNSLGLYYDAISENAKALNCFEKALKLHEEIKNKKGMASETMNIGGLYKNQGDFPNALVYNLRALNIYEEIADRKGIAAACRNIGVVYRMQSNYPKALEYFLKALKISEDANDKKDIANALTNIGNLYFFQNELSRALDHYFKALKIGEETGNKNIISSVTGNIGNIYQLQNDYPKAMEYYQKALKVNEEIGNKDLMASVTGNIGSLYTKQGNYATALEYFQKALKLYEETNELHGVATHLCNVGEVYNAMMMDTTLVNIYKLTAERKIMLKKAIEYLQKSLKVCKQTGDLDIMQTCYENLAKAYKIIGDHRSALECAENYHAIKDSVFSTENDKKIIEQQMQHDYEKKEAIAKAEQDKKNIMQKNIRNSTIAAMAGMFIFSVVVFRQRNRVKKEKEKVEKEKARSEELLLNILPAEVAEELKSNGSTEAKMIEDVTVLFTDFKGFTQLAEKLSPKELVAEINTCFSAFDHIMQKHGVEKIKTIGDAYMAAGGLPTPNKTHANDVVKAALEIQTFMHHHKEEREAAGKLFFEIRIGVHTGPVVAGIVGIKKFAYDIWGDTVNTASRMESSGGVSRVNISETTYELVKEKFTCEYRGEVEAKGKGMMKMYYVKV